MFLLREHKAAETEGECGGGGKQHLTVPPFSSPRCGQEPAVPGHSPAVPASPMPAFPGEELWDRVRRAGGLGAGGSVFHMPLLGLDQARQQLCALPTSLKMARVLRCPLPVPPLRAPPVSAPLPRALCISCSRVLRAWPCALCVQAGCICSWTVSSQYISPFRPVLANQLEGGGERTCSLLHLLYQKVTGRRQALRKRTPGQDHRQV